MCVCVCVCVCACVCMGRYVLGSVVINCGRGRCVLADG